MCDHIDGKGNCLGWEIKHWQPWKRWIYNYKLKQIIKKLKTDPKFMQIHEEFQHE